MRCIVCGRILKDQKSMERGFGPRCSKKIDQEAKKEIKDIVAQGFIPKILGDRIIQAEIPVEDPGEWPEIVDGRGKKWNYPKGVR